MNVQEGLALLAATCQTLDTAGWTATAERLPEPGQVVETRSILVDSNVKFDGERWLLYCAGCLGWCGGAQMTAPLEWRAAREDI